MEGVDFGQGREDGTEGGNLVFEAVGQASSAVVVFHHAGIAVDVVDADAEAAREWQVAGREGEGHSLAGDEAGGEEPLVGEGDAVPGDVDDEGRVAVHEGESFGVDLRICR